MSWVQVPSLAPFPSSAIFNPKRVFNQKADLSLCEGGPCFTVRSACNAGVRKQEKLMKAIVLAAAAGALALGLATPPAQARTCFRESLTDSAGHHAIMRGCSVARHHDLRHA